MKDKKLNSNIQHVYLYMDDSGKISKSEDYAIFAGIVAILKSQNLIICIEV